MPAMTRIALSLGLALGASAAKNSIVAPTGAEKLTVGLLGGWLIQDHTLGDIHGCCKIDQRLT